MLITPEERAFRTSLGRYKRNLSHTNRVLIASSLLPLWQLAQLANCEREFKIEMVSLTEQCILREDSLNASAILQFLLPERLKDGALDGCCRELELKIEILSVRNREDLEVS